MLDHPRAAQDELQGRPGAHCSTRWCSPDAAGSGSDCLVVRAGGACPSTNAVLQSIRHRTSDALRQTAVSPVLRQKRIIGGGAVIAKAEIAAAQKRLSNERTAALVCCVYVTAM